MTSLNISPDDALSIDLRKLGDFELIGALRVIGGIKLAIRRRECNAKIGTDAAIPHLKQYNRRVDEINAEMDRREKEASREKQRIYLERRGFAG